LAQGLKPNLQALLFLAGRELQECRMELKKKKVKTKKAGRFLVVFVVVVVLVTTCSFVDEVLWPVVLGGWENLTSYYIL